tara:strand:- start:700 stop:1128 length:429 start_codon:yes stop_codon:yes gene_type:complete
MIKTDMSTKEEGNPITLVTKVIVKDEMLTEYIELADQTSIAIRSSEEGIIFQHFGKNDQHPNSYTWIEIFKNEYALQAHIQNPIQYLYNANHNYLGESLTFEIHGNISNSLIKEIKDIGYPTEIISTEISSNIELLKNFKYS